MEKPAYYFETNQFYIDIFRYGSWNAFTTALLTY